MSNDVYSTLYFVGPKDEIQDVMSKIKGSDSALSSRAIIPDPKKVYDRDWCYENWGSARDVYDVILNVLDEHGDMGVNIMFSSAWSHIQPVIKKLSEMFPEQTFCYSWEEYSEEKKDFILIQTEFDNGVMKFVEY